MKVLNITENEDGSADVLVEISNDEKKFLIEYAINDMIRTTIMMEKEEDFNPETDAELDIEDCMYYDKDIIDGQGVIIDDDEDEDLFEGETDL